MKGALGFIFCLAGVLILFAVIATLFLGPKPAQTQPGAIDWYPVWDHGVMCYTWRPINENYPIAMSCIPIEAIPGADYLWLNWRDSVRHTDYRDTPKDGSAVPYFIPAGTMIPGPTVEPNPGGK